MIKFIFYSTTSLSLIILQTSVLPLLPLPSNGFDFLLIIVLFLSLMFSNNVLLIPIIMIGWGMDSLSGAPLGLYTISYIWIFLIVQSLKKYVHRGNAIFLPCISAFAVILENGFLFFSFFIRHGGNEALAVENISIAAKQSLLGFFLIPICIVIIHGIHTVCDRIDSKGII